MKSLLTLILGITIFAQTANSGPLLVRAPASKKSAAKAEDVSAPPRGSASANAPTVGNDRLLWDAWYTITIGKGIHYSFYNDRVELKGGRVAFQTKASKLEEDYINQEQIGVFAEFTPDLAPLFFNFHSTYRSTETTIDGNVKDGKKLSVRVRKGNTELPIIHRNVPSKTFLSTLFPVWLGFHLPELKPGKLYSFNTLLEDNVDAGFMPVHGQVRVEAPDAIALKTGTTKISVNYRQMSSVWWVEKTGAPVRIELKQQGIVVERTDAKTAQAFLDGH